MPVVSSTAAASLRQGVMVIFDKISVEDAPSVPSLPTTEIDLPDGTKASLLPAALDGYNLFEDLCVLTDSAAVELGNDGMGVKKQRLLMLESLPRPFGLELIESILSNHAGIFEKVSCVHVLLPCVSCLLADALTKHT